MVAAFRVVAALMERARRPVAPSRRDRARLDARASSDGARLLFAGTGIGLVRVMGVPD